MTDLFWLGLGILFLIGGARALWRLREGTRAGGGTLSDEEIRRLERGGSIEFDLPTDLDEVAEAEERFWGESWDEPDEPFY